MDFVDLPGLRIGYRQRGSGPPLLLLHGAVCDSRVWRRALASLSDTYTVVAWDAPGCGGSSDPPPGFRMPEYGRCLTDFIDAIGLDHPHVLGHSWGSTLALELYGQRPSTVRSLVLVGGYAGWGGSLPPEEVEQRLRFARQVAALPPGEWDPETMPGLFSDALPADRAEELRAIMSEIRPSGTEAMAHALAEADLREVLPRIRVPTLVLHGDDDLRSPSSVAGSLHASIPGSVLTVIPGVGHELFLEAPERFEAEVRRFLARH